MAVRTRSGRRSGATPLNGGADTVPCTWLVGTTGNGTRRNSGDVAMARVAKAAMAPVTIGSIPAAPKGPRATGLGAGGKSQGDRMGD